MAIPIRSIMQVTYEQQVNNQTIMNVLHYTNMNDYPTKDPIAVCDAMVNVLKVTNTNPLVVAMKALQSVTLDYKHVHVQLIYPIRYVKRTGDMATNGDAAGLCNAQNVAFTITKKATFANRSGIGSFHLGGIGDGKYAEGLISPGAFIELDGVAEQMLINIAEPVEGTTWFPCLANRTPIVGTDPVKYQISGSVPISYTVAQTTLRVMRRRTVGLGI